MSRQEGRPVPPAAAHSPDTIHLDAPCRGTCGLLCLPCAGSCRIPARIPATAAVCGASVQPLLQVMMNTTARRVFTPGAGSLPPALTGREREESVFLSCLADLAGGKAPPHDVVLTGPRGNGKTTLLNWFERKCRAKNPAVDVVRLTPSRVRTEKALVEALLPASGVWKLLPAKWGLAGIGTAEWSTAAPSAQLLTQRLIARCRGRALVVLLDEAHTLDLGVGQLLLNVSQEIRADAPFLLVLAGTPGLPAHLGAMDATFWNRLGKGRLGVGRLDLDAAREALEKPLVAHGSRIDRDALDVAVEESRGYPYFIQLWGEALWDRRLQSGAHRLAAGDAAAVRPVVAVRVTDYYEDRFLELDQSGWLAVAKQVGARFQSAPTLTYETLKAAVGDGLALEPDRGSVLDGLAALERLGFVWRPPGQSPPARYEPGIPSLMDYVLEHHAPPVAGEHERGAPTCRS